MADHVIRAIGLWCDQSN